MNEPGIKKLYYSVSEVCHLTSLKPHVLRHWENEFPELKPAKNRAGNRVFRLNDIRFILLLKRLLYIDKYTFEGARQQLKRMKRRSGDNRSQLSFETLLKEDMMFELAKELRSLLGLLKNSNHT
jgi:DNA-binding transcriptional MerR regulator